MNWSLIVMRPKSIATVVVVLASTPATSSTRTPRSVRISSVRSGLVSETAPTSVVFPAPKPPAMRILIALGSLRPCRSKRMESIDHCPVHLLVVHEFGVGLRVLHRDETLVEKITEQHAHGDGRKSQMPGDLRDGHHLLAEPYRGVVLRAQPQLRRRRQTRRLDHGDQVEGAAYGLHPAAGHDVRAHQRSGLVIEPPRFGLDVVVGRRSCVLPRDLLWRVAGGGHDACSGVRDPALRWWPRPVTSIAISYAMSPMSASSVLSTARQAPWPATVTRR